MSKVWHPHLFVCSKCGETMDDRQQTFWTKIEGWDKPRRAGGQNHVALRRPINEFMCIGCMDKLRAGLDPGQAELAI